MYQTDQTSGQENYKVKTSKNKKGQLRTEIIYAPYKLYKDSELILSGTTDPNGQFKIENLNNGVYSIQVYLNKYLNADTVFYLSKRRTKINIKLNDVRLWEYLDSTQLAKYPFNRLVAKQDIENGNIKILTAGLQVMTDEESDSLTTKYGFKYYPVAGCVVDNFLEKAMDDYNDFVYGHLDKINEPGWRDRLKADIRNFYLSKRDKNAR